MYKTRHLLNNDQTEVVLGIYGIKSKKMN